MTRQWLSRVCKRVTSKLNVQTHYKQLQWDNYACTYSEVEPLDDRCRQGGTAVQLKIIRDIFLFINCFAHFLKACTLHQFSSGTSYPKNNFSNLKTIHLKWLGQNICNFASTINFFSLVNEKEQLQTQCILIFSCVEMGSILSHYEEKIQYVMHKEIYY